MGLISNGQQQRNEHMKSLDPNYGDNTICDCCGVVFDVRNSPHEVIDDPRIVGSSLWLCGSCCSKYEDTEE
jgi:hypothetical protein